MHLLSRVFLQVPGSSSSARRDSFQSLSRQPTLTSSTATPSSEAPQLFTHLLRSNSEVGWCRQHYLEEESDKKTIVLRSNRQPCLSSLLPSLTLHPQPFLKRACKSKGKCTSEMPHTTLKFNSIPADNHVTSDFLLARGFAPLGLHVAHAKAR